jgi:dienelactone hydrolase
MRLRAVVAVAVVAASVAVMRGQAAAVAAGPRFHFAESMGPHAVGLKVVEQYDFSRMYRPKVDAMGKPTAGERARPLQTLIWYPAVKGSGKPMTVGDYGELAATETSFGKPAMSVDMKDWIKAMTPTLGDKMSALRDAKMEAGRFPVVIYAPSFSAMSWENADLCEYLASHGYVVIASPDMGATSRGMTNDVTGINAQAGDISFLIGYAQTLTDTDMAEVAVAGFSWGGISNLFAAARDNRIDALVALDGSMRYYAGLVKAAGDVHPEEMAIPLLFFTQGAISLEEQAQYFTGKDNEGPSVLNAWTHGDLVTVDDMALVHTEHSSMYQRNEDVWKHYAGEHKGDYTRADGIVGYAWVARYTLEFLDGYLKHDAGAMAFLERTPAENGVPAHMMTEEFRAAKGSPATFEALRVETGKQGFDHLAEVYGAMKKEMPEFKIEESAMYDWAMELEGDNHLPEAIDVMKLETQVYLESSNAYETLGEAYEKAGEKGLAVESYKKALEKNPENGQAKVKAEGAGGCCGEVRRVVGAFGGSLKERRWGIFE